MSRQLFPNRWLIIAALLLGVFTASTEENDLAARLKAIHFDYTNREQPVDFAFSSAWTRNYAQ